MRDFLLTILGISLFTAAFCGILVLRPHAPGGQSTPARVAVSSAAPTPVASTTTPVTPTVASISDTAPTPAITQPATIPPPPATPPAPITTNKHIFVSLKDQTLQYFEGDQLIGQFKISSGVRGMPTPPGEYTVLIKKPVVDYKGPTYDFPNTKWNLMFKANVPLNYYIHGAYWHHNFGHPMSHGCVNVAYADMEGLYNWADVGTPITIE